VASLHRDFSSALNAQINKKSIEEHEEQKIGVGNSLWLRAAPKNEQQTLWLRGEWISIHNIRLQRAAGDNSRYVCVSQSLGGARHQRENPFVASRATSTFLSLANYYERAATHMHNHVLHFCKFVQVNNF
jgi:hypothetical protein